MNRKDWLLHKLQRLPLGLKVFFLFFFAVVLFCSNLLVAVALWHWYFFALLVFVMGLTRICYLVLGRKAFKSMLQLWMFGVVIYLLFAIPRIYLHGSLTPYLTLINVYDRWLYSLLLPLIILGTLAVGLTFMSAVSPIEFLAWGEFGLQFVLLLRAIQYAVQAFKDTKLALTMQDKWPEEQQGLFQWHTIKLIIINSPDLIRTAFRNIILYWFPWGWLCFNKLQRDSKIKI